jgi:hypothetical protein
MSKRGNKKARPDPEPEQEPTILPEEVLLERQNSIEQSIGDNYNFSMPPNDLGRPPIPPNDPDRMDVEPEIEILQGHNRGTKKRRHDEVQPERRTASVSAKTSNATFNDAFSEFERFGNELINDTNQTVDEKVGTYERLINKMLETMGAFKESCEKFRDKQMNKKTVEEFQDELKKFNESMMELLGDIASSDISPASMRKLYDKITPKLVETNQAFREFVADPSKIDIDSPSKPSKTPSTSTPSRIDIIRQLFKTEMDILLKMITMTYEKVSSQAPDKCRKLASSLAVLIIIYNYLPINVRNTFRALPYLGASFNVIDSLHTPLLYSQNTALVSTGIFYFLKNVGDIDLTGYVISVRENAKYGLESLIGNSARLIMKLIVPSLIKEGVFPISDDVYINSNSNLSPVSSISSKESNSSRRKTSKRPKRSPRKEDVDIGDIHLEDLSSVSSKSSVAPVNAVDDLSSVSSKSSVATVNAVDDLLSESGIDAPDPSGLNESDPVTENRYTVMIDNPNMAGEAHRLENELELVPYDDTRSEVSSISASSQIRRSEDRVFGLYRWIWNEAIRPSLASAIRPIKKAWGSPVTSDSDSNSPIHGGRRRKFKTRKARHNKLRRTRKSLHL